MKQYRLNIDGKRCWACLARPFRGGQENGIDIPTLCYDERTTIYGACGLCVVEVEGNPKLVKACATEIAPNMVVKTSTPRVLESRKTNLELLLSNHVGDCRPPCVLNCPAGTDCQGYVGLIANGRFEEAIALIRERIPCPAPSAGCVPTPARTTAERALVDEPISIAWLKRFCRGLGPGRRDPLSCPTSPPKREDRIAIIGGGPYWPVGRLFPAPDGACRDDFRGHAQAGRHAALRHPRIPPAQVGGGRRGHTIARMGWRWCPIPKSARHLL